jgi:hypothetical protein
VKLAEEIATSKTTAAWIKEQGEVAATADMPPLDKIAIITTALVAKLKELEVLAYFTDEHLERTTRALMHIVTQRDADELHAGLRDRVLGYVHTVLEVDETDETCDEQVQLAHKGVEKVLNLLRFEEITPDQAMSLLMFYFTWLACELNRDMTDLRQKVLVVDERLWQLLTPYVEEDSPPTTSAAKARA